MKKLILSLIPVLLLNGCNWQRNVEEGDKNTYTWKGRLVEDCTLSLKGEGASVHLFYA